MLGLLIVFVAAALATPPWYAWAFSVDVFLLLLFFFFFFFVFFKALAILDSHDAVSTSAGTKRPGLLALPTLGWSLTSFLYDVLASRRSRSFCVFLPFSFP
jgi:hypothetical protein